MLLAQAQQIAIAICNKLKPHCVDGKLNIAGSIRRKKAEVGDIEICCIPNKVPAGQGAFFEEDLQTGPTKAFKEIVLSLGMVELGKPEGRQMKILLPEGIKLDLFIPQEPDYYRIYAIRTGSSTYSNLVLAHAWKRLGWCGTDHGLRKIIDCKKTGEDQWKLINPAGEKPPYWTSEQDFFNWLQIDYKEPYLRDIQSTASIYQKTKMNK